METLGDDVRMMARTQVMLVGMLVAGHFVATKVVEKVPLLSKVQDWWSVVDVVFSIPFYPVLSYFAVMASWELSGQDDRVTGKSANSYYFCMLFVAKSLVHMFITLQQKLTKSFLFTTLLHHSCSIVCMLGTPLCGRLIFYSAFDGVCEITNIFLSVLYLFKMTKTADRYPLLYSINGVLLWTSFLFFRIFLFPVWFFLFYQDYARGAMSSVSSAELVGYPAVTLLIMCMSVNWFIPITKGLLKVVLHQKEDWELKKQQ
eukprot:TRINITY_DN710_c0_g1_i1.p1 TRINITY_DN710_c0_g1~~TRINITY_DN710_c0_g1_i1.p1  ORF type:complete len:259 (+),score=45.43 TRINITY_DN710_c0_g1_i1:53-829(+)